jgi:hypothetical protein
MAVNHMETTFGARQCLREHVARVEPRERRREKYEATILDVLNTKS